MCAIGGAITRGQAIFPVMPRGVEHGVTRKTISVAWLAIFPVMPRGVEHRGGRMTSEDGRNAIFPVMPRGVEHVYLAARVLRCDARFFR